MPALDTDAAVSRALADYDKDGNRAFSKAELQQSPAFLAGFDKYDRDGSGEITEAEIQDRLQAYHDAGLAAFPWSCQVLLNGQPVQGATVSLIPEPMFNGPEFKTATGVTDEEGVAHPEIEGLDRYGPRYGLYRIEVSKKDAYGRELIPARYNAQTELGQEFAADVRSIERRQVLKLTSR